MPGRPAMMRFIPAPAGNANRHTSRQRLTAVHPRACGERRSCSILTLTSPGSSPRLRGTRPARRKCLNVSRFIPAPAGNAVNHRGHRQGATVHPRACGERAQRNKKPDYPAGSSPRLRGTLLDVLGESTLGRFIPAPAGNARFHAAEPFRWAVHPRACGERSNQVTVSHTLDGSSPRLRGTLRGSRLRYRADRFIPAPAGNAR